MSMSIASQNLEVSPSFAFVTVADLEARLGGIPSGRIRLMPVPGTATEADLLSAMEQGDGILELVDGVLVQKPMGLDESILAIHIARILGNFVVGWNLGQVSGPDGMMKVIPEQVRYPDVAFISWERYRSRTPKDAKAPRLAPDLAIEVLSEGNTEDEMDRKVREYFAGGVRLVWLIDAEKRTAKVLRAIDQAEEFGPDGVLSGGDVLPGFELDLGEVFSYLDQEGGESSAVSAN